MSQLLVIGSINADLHVHVEARPAPGQTVRGGPLTILPGGKGANQALAASLLGAQVSLVGAVGSDANAQPALEELHRSHVDLSQVTHMDGSTGTAVIVVSGDGENSIIVSAGANAAVTPQQVHRAIASSADDTVVLLQLELPVPVVETAVAEAHDRGLRVILNAAPIAPLSPQVLAACDPLVVNETEAADLLGMDSLDGHHYEQVATGLLALGPKSVVMTLGAAGCAVAVLGQSVVQIPAPRVTAVDTTGAGDAFVGALAAALCCEQKARSDQQPCSDHQPCADDKPCSGQNINRPHEAGSGKTSMAQLVTAAHRAVVVGALAVQKVGAQPSYPTADQLAAFQASTQAPAA